MLKPGDFTLYSSDFFKSSVTISNFIFPRVREDTQFFNFLVVGSLGTTNKKKFFIKWEKGIKQYEPLK